MDTMTESEGSCLPVIEDKTHAPDVRINQWVVLIKAHTNYRSDRTIARMLTFVRKVFLPAMGLTLDNWTKDAPCIVSEKLQDADMVRNLCGNYKNKKQKFQWLNIICKHLIPCQVDLPPEWVLNEKRKTYDMVPKNTKKICVNTTHVPVYSPSDSRRRYFTHPPWWRRNQG
jgi:hypothetical protein